MRSKHTSMTSIVLFGLALGCGSRGGLGNWQGSGGSAGSGGAAAEPGDLIRPRQPEMPPTVVDNPTQTRLIELWISDSVYALFGDGTVYNWWYLADESLALAQKPPRLYEGMDGPSQIERDALLYVDGTARWWLFGANRVAMTQGIAGIDHAVAVSDGCALIRDGSVRCWETPPQMLYLTAAPRNPAEVLDLPRAVELSSSLNSRCTLVRDRAGTVTRFRAEHRPEKWITSDVASVSLPSRAVRLFSGCAIPETGNPVCYYAPGGLWDTLNPACGDTPHYEVTTPGGEHLALVSLGGNFRGVALGDSGTVYATLDVPDPKASTIEMKPLPGVGRAQFVRSGVYVSCAVESPVIKCWPHEGRTAFQPAVVTW